MRYGTVKDLCGAVFSMKMMKRTMSGVFFNGSRTCKYLPMHSLLLTQSGKKIARGFNAAHFLHCCS